MDNEYWVKVHEYIHREWVKEQGTTSTSNPKPRTWEELEELINNKGGKN